jgi:exoribonuclease-2
MNVLFEEQGDFKLGTVLADNDTSLQVETASGKRVKLKSSTVLLRFADPGVAGLMAAAQVIADDIDVDFLWQCCGADEFGFESLALEYFGRKPSIAEATGILLRLHSAPMYFYRRGKGRFKAAPEETLKAALAAVERKRRLAEQQQHYVDTLLTGVLPPQFEPLRARLLYKPDRNTVEAKAMDAACDALKLSSAKLFQRCGALPDVERYHLDRFLFEYFPDGEGFPDMPVTQLANDLPHATAPAYSIDDASTTEIDDAFSVVDLGGGLTRIGVHIAAPALGIPINSDLDRIARRRLSTVYMPGGKITMLPPAAIESYTLVAGRRVPSVSFYFDLSHDFEVLATESRVESVWIEENLRHDTLDPVFNDDTVAAGRVEHAIGGELLRLYAMAERFEQARGKADGSREQRAEYNFRVDNGRIEITERQRGSPIDKVVSELMILVNSRWGRMLDEHQWAGVFRSQQDGRVKLASVAAPHQGLGVTHYIWASSPLRRYVDLINQRQLIALIRGEAPPYARNDDALFAAMRDFELAYEAYGEFQRQMERYWCLRWIEQESARVLSGRVIRDTLIRLERLPLVLRVPSVPDLAPGSRVELTVTGVDLIDLELACQFRERLAA